MADLNQTAYRVVWVRDRGAGRAISLVDGPYQEIAGPLD